MPDQESTPGYSLPGYIDPAVLRPGQVVYSVLDSTHTPLTVLKVEPMLVCRKPDGTGIMVYAHEVVIDDAPTSH